MSFSDQFGPVEDHCRGCGEWRKIAVDMYCNTCWLRIRRDKHNNYAVEFPVCSKCGDKILYQSRLCTFCEFEEAEVVYYQEEPRGWWDNAKCLGEDQSLFFPEKGKATREALAMCAACPVRAECLAEGMEQHDALAFDYGVWGGTTPWDRRQMRTAALHEPIEHDEAA